MKLSILNKLTWVAFLLAITSHTVYAQDCDIDCPGDDVVVEYNSPDGFVVPDFFEIGVVGFTFDCEGGNFFQNPAPGTVLTEGEYEVDVEIIAVGEDPDCDFDLVVMESGGSGGNDCEINCPDTLFVNVGQDGTYAIPDYYLETAIFSGECVFEQSVQTPDPGILVDNTYTEVSLSYTINGVTGECNFTIVSENPLGINDSGHVSSVTFYPNPAHDAVSIDTDEVLVEVIIYDLSRQEILRTKHSRVNLSYLAGGMYLLEINTERNRYLKRLLIE